MGYEIGKKMEPDTISSNKIIKASNSFYGVSNTGNELDFLMKYKIQKACEDFFQIHNINASDMYNITVSTNFNETLINQLFQNNCIFHHMHIYYILYTDFILIFNMDNYSKYTCLNIEILYNNNKYNNINNLKALVKNIFKDYICEDFTKADFKWHFCSARGVDYKHISEILDDHILPEAYPFISDLENYIQNYINSDESIILLNGIPGSGKTRLIRHIIKQYINKYKFTKYLDDMPVYYTTDEKVLQDDSIFISYIYSQKGILVLEDIDWNLESRDKGNTFMYKLLGSSDGLIRSENKKIILSTNLSSISTIDKALIRDGRCFDIIKFRQLTKDEAILFLNKFHVDYALSENKNEYTLAELYKILKGDKKQKFQINKIGFK